MTRPVSGLVVVCVLAAVVGCRAPAPRPSAVGRTQLRQQVMDYLSAAVAYPHNPVVRVEAVEALEAIGRDQSKVWIRTSLADEHPAVRFAACVALGRLRDRGAIDALRRCAADEDASVAAAAAFALHRLGDTDRSGLIPSLLVSSKIVAVRRNAALLLGLLGEPSAVQILAGAMRDKEESVRHHVLEALARLGNPEACRELRFMANAGVGAVEVFAINALAATRDQAFVETYQYKLATAPHIETRLAAARALGMLGIDDGYETAVIALGGRIKPLEDVKDPVADQRLRITLLAISALGEIGREEAVALLERQMIESKDPRVQTAAAGVLGQLLERMREEALPFGTSVKGR